MTRPLYEIAEDIQKDWVKMSPYAKPYVEALFSLNSIRENYILDSGSSIVAYFLANAAGWRGDTAKRIKAELKEMLKHA